MKICIKCGKELPETEFYKCKNAFDGLRPDCIACHKAYQETRKEREKQLYQQNREQRLAKRREYYQNNKEKWKNYNLDKEDNRRRWNKNREQYLNTQKLKLQNDPIYRLGATMSKGIYKSLRENKAEQHWEDLVPYKLKDIKEHLERQFDENMSWENMGEYWEIDHIIPMNQFSNKTKQITADSREFQICWSLMNLRPLNWIENRKRPKDGSDISEELRQQILSQNV